MTIINGVLVTVSNLRSDNREYMLGLMEFKGSGCLSPTLYASWIHYGKEGELRIISSSFTTLILLCGWTLMTCFSDYVGRSSFPRSLQQLAVSLKGSHPSAGLTLIQTLTPQAVTDTYRKWSSWKVAGFDDFSNIHIQAHQICNRIEVLNQQSSTFLDSRHPSLGSRHL